MATRDGQVIGSATSTTSIDWQADRANAVDHLQNHRMLLQGSGAISATVALYKGTRVGANVVFDATPAATYTLSGTNQTSESARIVAAEAAVWRATISAISGTGATLTWVVEIGERD